MLKGYIMVPLVHSPSKGAGGLTHITSNMGGEQRSREDLNCMTREYAKGGKVTYLEERVSVLPFARHPGFSSQ